MKDQLTHNYIFDVAFSFEKKDEQLALNLYNLLKERLKCFIYTEEQKRLAGSDGEQEFNSVFSSETRIAVILFNSNWGKTPWTRIEETAIKNRAHDAGYGFVILIPTEDGIETPAWFPRNLLWVGLKRWGIDGAASTIEQKVREFGGDIRIESIADKVAKSESLKLKKNERERLLASTDGHRLNHIEQENLYTILKRSETEIKQVSPHFHILVRKNQVPGYDVLSNGYTLTFQFYEPYYDSLDGAYIAVKLFKGHLDERGGFDVFSKPELLSQNQIRYDINEFEEKGWSLVDSRKNFMTSEKLVETWLEKLITLATKDNSGRQRLSHI